MRALAIHDLSGFGHTSLLSEIPIMYRMGIELAVLPTALLSANTDYPNYLSLDTTSFMRQSLEHWLQLGLSFDAIHSGFLGCPAQVQLLLEYLPQLRTQPAPILVDPVLGDGGKLYSCYTIEMVKSMRNLLSIADIITPNFTEAALLLDKDPAIHNIDLNIWCQELALMGPKQVIITSVPCNGIQDCILLHYAADDNSCTSYYPKYESISYPGAGDSFSSMLLAAILRGHSLPVAIKGSMEFIKAAFHLSIPLVQDIRSGMALAKALQPDPTCYFTS